MATSGRGAQPSALNHSPTWLGNTVEASVGVHSVKRSNRFRHPKDLWVEIPRRAVTAQDDSLAQKETPRPSENNRVYLRLPQGGLPLSEGAQIRRTWKRSVLMKHQVDYCRYNPFTEMIKYLRISKVSSCEGIILSTRSILIFIFMNLKILPHHLRVL